MSFSFVPPPSELRAPTLYEVGEDWIMVQWNALAAGHVYELQWKEAEAAEWVTASSSLQGNVVKKKGLDEDKHYVFRVRARDASGGWGPFSDPSKPFAPVSNDARMEAPTPYDLAHDSLTVQWHAVEGALAYEVQFKTVQGEWETASNRLTSTLMKKKGLAPGTRYQFRVRPQMSAGWGPFSLASMEITTALAHPFFVDLLGESLVDAQGNQHSTHEIGGKTTALYFASHDSQACKLFTSELQQFYFQSQAAGKDLSVVIVSCDDSVEKFELLIHSSPFLAVPFAAERLRAKTREVCGVDARIVPRLVLLSPVGDVIEKAVAASALNMKSWDNWDRA